MKAVKKLLITLLVVSGFFMFAFQGTVLGEACYFDVGDHVYSEGPRDSARVYYPCNIGELSDVGATTLTSGMAGTKENMYWLAEPIANAGMIAVTVSAADNMSVSGYETAHKTGIGILQEENTISESPLYNKVGNLGIMGYSMGGGGSIDAASDLGDQVDTSIGLAPYNPEPTSNLSAATMILTGEDDAIAPASMGYDAFQSLPEVPKLYTSIEGEGHMFWANNSNPGNADDLIVAWLKYYLEGDDSYLPVIENPGPEFIDYEYYPEGGGGGTPPGGCY